METKRLVWARQALQLTAFLVAFYAACRTRGQFMLWHADAAGAALLLPPYGSFGYFARYAFTRFWLEYVLSAIAAAGFFAAARRLNAARGGMIFEKEELYFLAIGLFASGHPGWIFYLLLVLGAYLLASVIGAAAYGARARVSFYYFWLPCALVTVVLNAYLHEYAWYANLLI